MLRAELLLDSEVPFLNGGRLGVGLDALRREDRAQAGGCAPGVIGRTEGSAAVNVSRAVIGRQRVQQEARSSISE